MFENFNENTNVDHFSISNSSLEEVLDQMALIRNWYYDEVVDNDAFYNLEELSINYNKLCALYDRFATIYGTNTNKMYLAQSKRDLYFNRQKRKYTLGEKKTVTTSGEEKTITRKMTDAFATTLVQSSDEYLELHENYLKYKGMFEQFKIISYAKSSLIESFKSTLFLLSKQISNNI
jgi:hypothetical protein